MKYTLTDYKTVYQNVHIELENYKYQGENRIRCNVKERGNKLFSFTPQFGISRVDASWLSHDYVWFVSSEYNKHYLRRIKYNGKKVEELSLIECNYYHGLNLYESEQGTLYFVDDKNGLVYFYKTQTKEFRKVKLAPYVQDLKIYNEDIFVFKGEYGKACIYKDGRVSSVEELLEYDRILPYLRAFYNNHMYYVYPQVVTFFDDASIKVTAYDIENNIITFEFGTSSSNNKEFQINMDTGELSDLCGNVLNETQLSVKLYPWHEMLQMNGDFLALQKLFEERETELAMLYNKRNVMSYQIYYVTEYDEATITISFWMNGDIYKGIYDRQNQNLSLEKQEPVKCLTRKTTGRNSLSRVPLGITYDNGEKESTYFVEEDGEWGFKSSIWKRNANMHQLNMGMDLHLRRFEAQLQGLTDFLTKMLQYKEYEKGNSEYEKAVFSFGDLIESTYQVAGFVAGGTAYNCYPIIENGRNIPDEEIEGIILILNLQRLGYIGSMAVGYFFHCNSKIRIAKNVMADTRHNWHLKMKPLWKNYSIPHVPGIQDAMKMIPTMSTIDSPQYKVECIKHRNEDNFYITRRFDDHVYEGSELENPQDRVFSKYSVYCVIGTGKLEHPILKKLQAYAVAEAGIFYVPEGSSTIMYMHENGKRYKLLEGKNVLEMSYQNGVLTYSVYEGLQQTDWNKHFDVLGGLSEEWRDYYRVISHKETYNTANLMRYIREKG